MGGTNGARQGSPALEFAHTRLRERLFGAAAAAAAAPDGGRVAPALSCPPGQESGGVPADTL